jgi:hypothetical protein
LPQQLTEPTSPITFSEMAQKIEAWQKKFIDLSDENDFLVSTDFHKFP